MAVIKLLLEKGADLGSKSNSGQAALSWAVSAGNTDDERIAVVQLLLDNGAELESKDKEYGRAPLSWAAGRGHETIVQLLLEKGAYFETKSNIGWTPLSFAIEMEHESIVKLLVENSAELEVKDGYAQMGGHDPHTHKLHQRQGSSSSNIGGSDVRRAGVKLWCCHLCGESGLTVRITDCSGCGHRICSDCIRYNSHK